MCASTTSRSRRALPLHAGRARSSDQPVDQHQGSVRGIARPGWRPAVGAATRGARARASPGAEAVGQPSVVDVASARPQGVVDPRRDDQVDARAVMAHARSSPTRRATRAGSPRSPARPPPRARARPRGAAPRAGRRPPGRAPRSSCSSRRASGRRRGSGSSARRRPALSSSVARPMSTTIPCSSSVAPRNVASTTNVAPCSRCAGPKTSPRRLWATIMWSRTVTLNTRPPSRPWRRNARVAQRRAGDPSASRGITSGRSSNRDCPVSSASNAGSRSRSSAIAAVPQGYDGRDGPRDTAPTWLERRSRRWLWKAPPSGGWSRRRRTS